MGPHWPVVWASSSLHSLLLVSTFLLFLRKYNIFIFRLILTHTFPFMATIVAVQQKFLLQETPAVQSSGTREPGWCSRDPVALPGPLARP